MLQRTKSSMLEQTAMALEKTERKEIPHPCSLLSTKYVNYLEDQKVKRFKEKSVTKKRRNNHKDTR